MRSVPSTLTNDGPQAGGAHIQACQGLSLDDSDMLAALIEMVIGL